MNVLFATGSDSAFFNSLLVCLQAFAERMPDCRLFVCDFGLTDAQSQFLRGLGLWLDRPPALRSSGPFRCKAALLRYLLHNGKKVEDYDAIVWLDADLTLMEVGKIDFQAVIDDMSLARAEIALCHAGMNVSQVISLFGESSRMLPFARSVADAAIDGSLPYFSTGLFFCRSAAVLSRWDELTESVIDHPLLDQNVFNVVLHRDAVPLIVLDLEEWQAQGESLDRVQLIVSVNNVRPTARIAEKNLKSAPHYLAGFRTSADCAMSLHSA